MPQKLWSDPARAMGELTALPDLLAGGEGARSPSLRTQSPLSALRASGFGPLSQNNPTAF